VGGLAEGEIQNGDFVLNHGNAFDASMFSSCKKLDENHGTLRYSFGHARAICSDAIHGQSSTRSTDMPPRLRRTSLCLLPNLCLAPERASLQADLPQLRLLP